MAAVPDAKESLPALVGLPVDFLGTLVAALIAATAAIVAVVVSFRMQRKSRERSVATALLNEVCVIKAVLDVLLHKTGMKEFVVTSKLESPSSVCGVYLGSAQDLGLLQSDVVGGVVNFYTMFLSISPSISASGPAHDIDELRRVREKADDAIRLLIAAYSIPDPSINHSQD
ncbi:MAG: hypothetical protein NXH87_17205 [Rhodobiaceae bacterium]|nr:hypothetical protein [Rhodobiaceae bacterium]